MSSFAATIFTGAFVTIGDLLMTFLIALVLMLKSAENIDLHLYSYGRTGFLHKELNINSFESYSLPKFGKMCLLSM